MIYWICPRPLPSKITCQALPFAEGLIQLYALKTPLYWDKHSGGTAANVTDSRHELWHLVDKQDQAVADIMHNLLFWHTEILLGVDMVKQQY